MVPGKTQFIAESGYLFARNSLGKETLGVQHYKPFVPILFASFFFVLVNNLYGAIPFIQLPSFSHPGSAYALAGVAYLTWVGVGIKRKGLGGFFKDITMPAAWRSGLPHSDPDRVLLEHADSSRNPRTASVRHHVRWSPGADGCLQHGDLHG